MALHPLRLHGATPHDPHHGLATYVRPDTTIVKGMNDGSVSEVRLDDEGESVHELRVFPEQDAPRKASQRTRTAPQARKKTQGAKEQPDLEGKFFHQIKAEGLPTPERQCRQPWPRRRFRADFCWPEERLVIEVDGATWKGKFGRHTSGPGYERDCEKRAIAVINGWRFINVTSRQVRDGTALEWAGKLLAHTAAAPPS